MQSSMWSRIALATVPTVPLCGRPGSRGGGFGGASPSFGTAGKFLKGGRWDRYLGKVVSVAEDGRPETFVGDDGTVQRLDGPQEVVPVKPGIVVPSGATSGAQSFSAAAQRARMRAARK